MVGLERSYFCLITSGNERRNKRRKRLLRLSGETVDKLYPGCLVGPAHPCRAHTHAHTHTHTTGWLLSRRPWLECGRTSILSVLHRTQSHKEPFQCAGVFPLLRKTPFTPLPSAERHQYTFSQKKKSTFFCHRSVCGEVGIADSS